MLSEYFQAAGPVMYLVLATWVVVFACTLDRMLYVFGSMFRRPMHEIRARAIEGDPAGARLCSEREWRRASRGLRRIDAVSQMATSVGLFGTVLGMARTFIGHGDGLAMAEPAALAAGLSTALFTTVGGLLVFLFGQGFLIAFSEWRSLCERGLEEVLASGDEG